MLWLAVVLAILAAIFGFWGFGTAADTAWGGAQILFWVFLVLFILSLFGFGGGYWNRRPLP